MVLSIEYLYRIISQRFISYNNIISLYIFCYSIVSLTTFMSILRIRDHHGFDIYKKDEYVVNSVVNMYNNGTCNHILLW